MRLSADREQGLETIGNLLSGIFWGVGAGAGGGGGGGRSGQGGLINHPGEERPSPRSGFFLGRYQMTPQTIVWASQANVARTMGRRDGL